jgi:transposase-like protein
LVGAGLHERSENRLTYRNGYPEREWDTMVGTVDLQILKLREGAYFPSLLEPVGAGMSGRSWRWSRRPTSTVSQPGRSTAWLRRWA